LESWALNDLKTQANVLEVASWTTFQALATHGAITWFLISEVEFWRAVLFPTALEYPTYPDLSPWEKVPSPVARAWYSRIFPSSIPTPSLIESPNILTWMTQIDWTYVAFHFILQVLYGASILGIFIGLQALTNPGHNSGNFFLWAGCGVFFTSERLWGMIANVVLCRPVRVVHAAVFGFVVEIGVKWIEGRREKKRKEMQVKSREDFAFYT
jgi:hypothetical protein